MTMDSQQHNGCCCVFAPNYLCKAHCRSDSQAYSNALVIVYSRIIKLLQPFSAGLDPKICREANGAPVILPFIPRACKSVLIQYD